MEESSKSMAPSKLAVIVYIRSEPLFINLVKLNLVKNFLGEGHVKK